MTTQSQAARIVGSVPQARRQQLGNDPAAALIALGFKLASVSTPTTQRGAQGSCDGLSFTQGRVIVYRSTDNRRENFTLLHEFAHFLVAEDQEALNWLADLSDTQAELERLCDAVAADLLLPLSVVDLVVGAGPIRAEHAIALIGNSEASHHAIAVRLASRLPCAGSVLMINAHSFEVAFAVNEGALQVWPWKNQTVPTGHVLRRLEPYESVTSKSFWSTPWGKRHDFYLDAKRQLNWTYVVLAEHDLWQHEKFHAPTLFDEVAERPEHHLDCPCGFHGTTVGFTCTDGGHPYCPRCKECLCFYSSRSEIDCPNPNCYMRVAANDIREGRCSFCE